MVQLHTLLGAQNPHLDIRDESFSYAACTEVKWVSTQPDKCVEIVQWIVIWTKRRVGEVQSRSESLSFNE